MPDLRVYTLSSLIAILAFGTAYSVVYNTYLDTSDPLLTSLPHPQHSNSYFAQKSNFLNQIFVKKSWGWTSGAFLFLWGTSPRQLQTSGRLVKWVGATAAWLAFVSWFFGPSLGQRIVSASGGECIVHIPGTDDRTFVSVPLEYCLAPTPIGPQSHPDIFKTASYAKDAAKWTVLPRLVRGHDVSGHIFLLTLSALFLADQLIPSLRLQVRSQLHNIAVTLTGALMTLWLFMTYTTAVYWHTPYEKISGFVIGLLAFIITQAASTMVTKEATTSKEQTVMLDKSAFKAN